MLDIQGFQFEQTPFVHVCDANKAVMERSKRHVVPQVKCGSSRNRKRVALRVSSLLPLLPKVTEHDVPPKWRHTRSVGQSVARRAPGWSGPRRMNNNQVM